MKENFESFTKAKETHIDTDLEVSLRAQTVMESEVKNFLDEFRDRHGSGPTEQEMTKILVGVKKVLEKDLRETSDEAEQAVLEKAINYVESDQALNEVKVFFETYERRRERRN